jgi:hypothetical protein
MEEERIVVDEGKGSDWEEEGPTGTGGRRSKGAAAAWLSMAPARRGRGEDKTFWVHCFQPPERCTCTRVDANGPNIL